MSWLAFAFSGPVLWAVSTHLDKYLVEKYFKNSNVAVLLIFTALIGLLTLPFIWFFAPQVANLSPVSAALMAFSGAPEFPIPFAVARAGQPTRRLAGRAGCEEKPRRSGV